MAEYESPATGETFTSADAEDAGWKIFHEGVDPETEGVTLNSTHWFAEKYVSPPGRAGSFQTVIGHSEEGLLAAIQQHELQFASNEEGTVLVAAEDTDPADVDTSEEGTVERITDAELSSAADNDALLVLSDPEDPESDPVHKIVVGGQEVDPEVLSEPTPASTQAEQEARDANQAAIDQAVEDRDAAETPSDANSPDASLSALGAETDYRQSVHDDANAEKTQPEAGEATDASDSEQQSQVPDAEAASSDAVSTNTTDAYPKVNESQPEEFGPDTDAIAPAPAPNATDAAVAFAEEHDIDLADVEGSGKDGKVTQPDVQKHVG